MILPALKVAELGADLGRVRVVEVFQDRERFSQAARAPSEIPGGMARVAEVPESLGRSPSYR